MKELDSGGSIWHLGGTERSLVGDGEGGGWVGGALAIFAAWYPRARGVGSPHVAVGCSRRGLSRGVVCRDIEPYCSLCAFKQTTHLRRYTRREKALPSPGLPAGSEPQRAVAITNCRRKQVVLTPKTLRLGSPRGKWGPLTELWLFLASLTTTGWSETLRSSRRVLCVGKMTSILLNYHAKQTPRLSLVTRETSPVLGLTRVPIASRHPRAAAGGLVKHRWPAHPRLSDSGGLGVLPQGPRSEAPTPWAADGPWVIPECHFMFCSVPTALGHTGRWCSCEHRLACQQLLPRCPCHLLLLSSLSAPS